MEEKKKGRKCEGEFCPNNAAPGSDYCDDCASALLDVMLPHWREIIEDSD